MSMKITLVSLNSQYVHSSLAVWYLKAALEKYAQTPHQTSIVEGTINEKTDAVLERILASEPDFLGFSTYIWNIKYVSKLLPFIEATLPNCTIVLGGPEVTYNPKEVLERYPDVDFILAGEGEKPIARLVDAIATHGDLNEVPGLSRRSLDGVKTKTPHMGNEIKISPFTSDYFEALEGRIAYIETSRGCPYSCAFCLSGREDKLRELPLERAYEEIVKLSNAGPKTIKFVDRTFNVNRPRCLAILQFISDNYNVKIPKGVTFHFEIAGDLLDDKTLSLIEQAPAGLFQFEIGLQSMHENTLAKVRRKTNMTKLKSAVSRLISCGKAHVHLDLIAGLPEEDLTGFSSGFNDAYTLGAHDLQLGFLKLIHGSAMREEAEIFPCRFDPEPPYEVQETPWLSDDDFRILHLVESGLVKLHNSGRFKATLDFLTKDCGTNPFNLFLQLGTLIAEAEDKLARSLSLEELTDLVFEELIREMPEAHDRLRGLILADRFASTATSFLPHTLRIKDARFTNIKRALEKLYPRPTNTSRAIAILYDGSKDQVLYCDHKDKDPVTGLYPIRILPLSELGIV